MGLSRLEEEHDSEKNGPPQFDAAFKENLGASDLKNNSFFDDVPIVNNYDEMEEQKTYY